MVTHGGFHYVVKVLVREHERVGIGQLPQVEQRGGGVEVIGEAVFVNQAQKLAPVYHRQLRDA